VVGHVAQSYNDANDTVKGAIHRRRPGLGSHPIGYPRHMLYTILIILAIVALVLFILGRRSV
jgi:hypothetical protein